MQLQACIHWLVVYCLKGYTRAETVSLPLPAPVLRQIVREVCNEPSVSLFDGQVGSGRRERVGSSSDNAIR